MSYQKVVGNDCIALCLTDVMTCKNEKKHCLLLQVFSLIKSSAAILKFDDEMVK